jgi:hypothetical protein
LGKLYSGVLPRTEPSFQVLQRWEGGVQVLIGFRGFIKICLGGSDLGFQSLTLSDLLFELFVFGTQDQATRLELLFFALQFLHTCIACGDLLRDLVHHMSPLSVRQGLLAQGTLRLGGVQQGVFFLVFVPLFLQAVDGLRDPLVHLHLKRESFQPHLFETLFLLFDSGAFLKILLHLPLQNWQRSLFVLPLFPAVYQGMLFEFEGMALLLDLALDVIFFLLVGIAPMQRLGQVRFTLARVLEFYVGPRNTGSIVQDSIAMLDLLIDFAPVLIGTLLLKFKPMLGRGNGVLQGIKALQQRRMLLRPCAGEAFLSLEALQLLVASNDNVFLL